MKRYILLLLLIPAVQISAQSTIDSIFYSPGSPTDTDTIYVYAKMIFPSTGCILEANDISFNGEEIQAWAHHCLGDADAICYATDSFKLEPLSAGEYPLVMSLTTGYGEIPCSPGIVVDDMDTIFIAIKETSSVENEEQTQNFVYPNPAVEFIQFKKPLNSNAILVNELGQIVLHIPAQSKIIDISELPQGFYYIVEETWKRFKLIKL